MGKTKIEWTATHNPDGSITAGKVWNPVAGCSRVSAGCDRCYAIRMAHRHGGNPATRHIYGGTTTVKPGRGVDWTGVVRFIPERLADPLRWRKPARVFVNSMSDLFHESLSNEDIAAVFGVMAACPRHQFQILTKRPERMRAWFAWMREFAMDQRDLAAAPSMRQTCMKAAFTAMGETSAARAKLDPHWKGDGNYGPWPLPNVWLGVSVEDQATADARIPVLLECPAAVRWISAEPLLGPVDLRLMADAPLWAGDGPGVPCRASDRLGLGWVVVGGESGPGARPMHPEWARGLRDQSAAAGVAFLFKQWGEWAPQEWPYDDGRFAFTDLDDVRFCRYGKRAAGRMLDGRTWDQYPEARHA